MTYTFIMYLKEKKKENWTRLSPRWLYPVVVFVATLVTTQNSNAPVLIILGQAITWLVLWLNFQKRKKNFK